MNSSELTILKIVGLINGIVQDCDFSNADG